VIVKSVPASVTTVLRPHQSLRLDLRNGAAPFSVTVNSSDDSVLPQSQVVLTRASASGRRWFINSTAGASTGEATLTVHIADSGLARATVSFKMDANRERTRLALCAVLADTHA
jgi:hypothetical protein